MTDYGTDVSTMPDLDITGNSISGRRALAERLARRIMTATGSLPYAPNDGIDVREWLSRALDDGEQFKLSAAVRHELEKDEEVSSVDVGVVWYDTLETIELTIQVDPFDGVAFTMVLSIDKVSAQILALDA